MQLQSSPPQEKVRRSFPQYVHHIVTRPTDFLTVIYYVDSRSCGAQDRFTLYTIGPRRDLTQVCSAIREGRGPLGKGHAGIRALLQEVRGKLKCGALCVLMVPYLSWEKKTRINQHTPCLRHFLLLTPYEISDRNYILSESNPIHQRCHYQHKLQCMTKVYP
jgi:hypothetical protein